MMNRRGFTLIELMIVVAILGILAAIAIGQFYGFQYRAKRAEVILNSNKAFSALHFYVSEKLGTGTFSAGFNPYPDPSSSSVDGRQARLWNAGVSATEQENWAALGWIPDGAMYCSYSANANGGTFPPIYSISAICDIDNDGVPLFYNVYGPHYSSSGTLRNVVDSCIGCF